jgi:hypothetical protein
MRRHIIIIIPTPIRIISTILDSFPPDDVDDLEIDLDILEKKFRDDITFLYIYTILFIERDNTIIQQLELLQQSTYFLIIRNSML